MQTIVTDTTGGRIRGVTPIPTNRLRDFFKEADSELTEAAGYDKTFHESINGFSIGDARALHPDNPECAKTLLRQLHQVLVAKQLHEQGILRDVLKNYAHYRSRDWDTNNLHEQYLEQHRRIILLQSLIDRTADLKRLYGVL